jgi:major membrane immunogen (membrane-anchored lipoprotein)
MKLLLIVVFSLLIGFSQAALSSSSCAENSNEEFIQGAWRLTGQNDPKHSWFLEWTFDKGKFDLVGYPPLHQSGKYRVLKTEGSKMTIELYEQKGELGTENSQVEIVIDRDKNTLMIRGQGPFTRVKPQTSAI